MFAHLVPVEPKSLELFDDGVIVLVTILKELSPLIQRLVPQPICNVSSLSAAPPAALPAAHFSG